MASRKKLQRVIIDTDPGVDDAQAILFALRLGAFHIDAVTTVFGNCKVTTATRNVRSLLELAGVDGVPVFMGAAEPLVKRRLKFAKLVHGPHGFGNFRPAQPAYPLAKGYAAAEMARIVAANPGKITILALGPLTNVAMAMRLDPSFTRRVQRIILMGGIVSGPGNVSAVATANVLNDPEAALIVFESGVDVTMVGQDVTRHVRVKPSLIRAIRNHGGPIARFLGRVTRHYESAYRKLEPHLRGFPVHDLLVIAYAVKPKLFDTKKLAVTIETSGTATVGMTVADFRPSSNAPANVTVCVDVDGPGVLDWYRKVILAS
jgi:inosine-uridine nucleoside N-ribohydrolase